MSVLLLLVVVLLHVAFVAFVAFVALLFLFSCRLGDLRVEERTAFGRVTTAVSLKIPQ